MNHLRLNIKNIKKMHPKYFLNKKLPQSKSSDGFETLVEFLFDGAIFRASVSWCSSFSFQEFFFVSRRPFRKHFSCSNTRHYSKTQLKQF